ncbi:MAG: hypothetical protein LBR17_08490 [Bacteroidales bacterium]|jgi:hypothetical protein|nr:hypothetical protein [Bacteroidales bacterium]
MTDKQALAYWEKLRKQTINGTPVDFKSPAAIDRHKKQLEGNITEWCKYFFPNYARVDFAPFHVKFLNRIIKNEEWYEVLSWSRELSKSTITMFVVLYLILTGRKHNVILTSASYDSAERLLEPYRIQLDSNQRIITCYGEQKSVGLWESRSFTTKSGASFLALGAGQSPRGTRKEEIRPDIIICDDFDTDEECRNADTIKKKWDWFENALYPTRSIDKPLLVIWCGNIIAIDCCITRAGAMADHWDIVNIRDKQGKSTWSAKNSEEHINRTLSKISARAAQQEYFNNPLAEGSVFKELSYEQIPSLSKFKFIINYGDPSPSNSKNKAGSMKAIAQVGFLNGKYYVIDCRCNHATNEEFVQWFYDLTEIIPAGVQVYNFIENNTLQDPFYEQVFKPLFVKLAAVKGYINIQPDKRKKADKFSRIEGNLQPLNNQGKLIINAAKKDNEHFKRLHEQFLLVNPQLKAAADGPDSVEGAVWMVNEKLRKQNTGQIMIFNSKNNRNRL